MACVRQQASQTKAFRILEVARLDVEKARVLLTLVDRRTKIRESSEFLADRLSGEIRARGWPMYETRISRSPRVETLNSGTAKPLSILHHARGTAVHGQFRSLAEEVLAEMGASERLPGLAVLEASEFEGPEGDPEENGDTPMGKGEAFQRLRGTESARREKSWTEELLGVFFRR